jgi:Uma2 family endonuclease
LVEQERIVSIAAPPPGRRTQSASSNGGRYHWTVDTFYRAIAAGVFDEPSRLELVKGEIWDRDVMNPPHATVTARIAQRFRALFEPRLFVREEKPLYLDFDGQPVPDVLVVNGGLDDYAQRHPGPDDVCLVVEVTDTTVERDTVEKALLYAQAGIADYWVALLNDRELLVYRNPTQDGYSEPQRLRNGDVVAPLFAPNETIAVADLLPRPRRNELESVA